MKIIGYRLSYNPGGTFKGRNSDAVLAEDLCRWIAVYRPFIISLQEVWDRKAAIREVARRTGYRPVIPKGAAGHCAFLLAPETRTKSTGAMMGTILLTLRQWVGRKVAGARKHGHARKNEGVFVRYNFAGLKWIDLVLHLVPSHHVPSANRLSKRQVRKATRWLRRRKRIASVSGDLNERPGFKRDTLGPLERATDLQTDVKQGTFGTGKAAIDYWGTLRRHIRKHRLVLDEPVALQDGHGDHQPLLQRVRQR